MSCDVETLVEPRFIRITARGNYCVAEMFDFINLVRSKADKAGRTRILMDCRQFGGNMTEAERFEGGQSIARVFGARLKAALLMPAEQITKLGELAAINRGARFFVTSSETEATDWLTAA